MEKNTNSNKENIILLYVMIKFIQGLFTKNFSLFLNKSFLKLKFGIILEEDLTESIKIFNYQIIYFLIMY